MKYQRIILLLTLCTCVAACDMPDFSYSGENGKATLNGNVLTLHVDSSPDATIGSSGDFTVDGKALPLAPAQRGLLVLYYQGVTDIREQASGMKAGIVAAKNAFAAKPDADAKQKLKDTVVSQAHQLTVKMCQDEANLKTVQDQLNAQVPAFKPYGDIFRARSAEDCIKDNDNDND
ncbi:hypothetical protein [Dyella nitratireducens]|uniref:hypothetical protein n=1 Tax=Dyella nitratireducens TaxID=1849580 RepID=UPI00166F4A91|nr:hypothetical protein [Dyella nitratireducens]